MYDKQTFNRLWMRGSPWSQDWCWVRAILSYHAMAEDEREKWDGRLVLLTTRTCKGTHVFTFAILGGPIQISPVLSLPNFQCFRAQVSDTCFMGTSSRLNSGPFHPHICKKKTDCGIVFQLWSQIFHYSNKCNNHKVKLGTGSLSWKC